MNENLNIRDVDQMQLEEFLRYFFLGAISQRRTNLVRDQKWFLKTRKD